MKVRGKKLQYLGMDLDYATPGEAKISMIPYVENIIQNFPEEIMGTVATPAAEHLFEIWRKKSLSHYLNNKQFTFTTMWLSFYSYVTVQDEIFNTCCFSHH